MYSLRREEQKIYILFLYNICLTAAAIPEYQVNVLLFSGQQDIEPR